MTAYVGFVQGEPDSPPWIFLGICMSCGHVLPSPRLPLSSSLVFSPCHCTLLCMPMSLTGYRLPSLRLSGRITSPCHTSRVPSGPADTGCPQTSRQIHSKDVKRRSSSEAGSRAATSPQSPLVTPRAPATPPWLKLPPMRPMTVYMREFCGATTRVITLAMVTLPQESRQPSPPFGKALKPFWKDLIWAGEDHRPQKVPITAPELGAHPPRVPQTSSTPL